jgi:hypothetical protein
MLYQRIRSVDELNGPDKGIPEVDPNCVACHPEDEDGEPHCGQQQKEAPDLKPYCGVAEVWQG